MHNSSLYDLIFFETYIKSFFKTRNSYQFRSLESNEPVPESQN